MTASGTFPKIDGDVLYAYDVNKLARYNRILMVGAGSYFYSGTDLTNNCDEYIKASFGTRSSASNSAAYFLLNGSQVSTCSTNSPNPVSCGDSMITVLSGTTLTSFGVSLGSNFTLVFNGTITWGVLEGK